MSTQNLPYLHAKIRKRWVLECSIIPQEHVHLGIGRESQSITATDLPIATVTKADGTKYPFIPGSSLKGLFRNHLYRIYNSIDDPNAVIKSMLPDLDPNIDFKHALSPDDLKQKEQAFQKMTEDETRREDEKKVDALKELDPIAKLFGISGFAAPLRFTDAYPQSDENVASLLVTRTHVKIDLGTDKAMRGALFNLEATAPDLTFKFHVIYEELDGPMDDATALFKILMKQLTMGIQLHLGGMKSRGYGLVTIKLQRYKIYDPIQLFSGEEPSWITPE